LTANEIHRIIFYIFNPFGATFSNLPNVICDVYFQRHKNRAKTSGKRLIWWESVRPLQRVCTCVVLTWM